VFEGFQTKSNVHRSVRKGQILGVAHDHSAGMQGAAGRAQLIKREIQTDEQSMVNILKDDR
jgi:hypothetical protein